MDKKRLKKYIEYCKSEKLKFEKKYEKEIYNSDIYDNYLSSLEEDINTLEVVFNFMNKK